MSSQFKGDKYGVALNDSNGSLILGQTVTEKSSKSSNQQDAKESSNSEAMYIQAIIEGNQPANGVSLLKKLDEACAHTKRLHHINKKNYKMAQHP